jgi:hypothetical protein
MKSYEYKPYSKVVELDMIYNFVVDNVFISYNLIIGSNIHIKYYVLKTSDIEIVYTKLIVRSKIYNFVVDIFLSEIV